MGTLPTTIVAPEKPQLSQPQRIINTFIDPVKTFTDLRRGTAWWMAWIFVALFSIGYAATVDTKIGFDQAMANQMKLASAKQLENIEKMPADQRAKMMSIQVTVMKIISYGFPILSLVIMVITAALLMATFRFGTGADVTFGASLAVVVYSHLPGIFRAILGIVTIFAGKDPESFYIENPVATNLGYFLDPLQHKAFYTLGSYVDVFSIWILVLTAIGFSCVTKVKRGTSYGIVFGLYAFVALVHTGFAALMS